MAGYFEHRQTSGFFKSNEFRSKYELLKDDLGSMEFSMEAEKLNSPSRICRFICNSRTVSAFVQRTINQVFYGATFMARLNETLI
jgi:hypothetical protein